MVIRSPSGHAAPRTSGYCRGQLPGLELSEGANGAVQLRCSRSGCCRAWQHQRVGGLVEIKSRGRKSSEHAWGRIVGRCCWYPAACPQPLPSTWRTWLAAAITGQPHVSLTEKVPASPGRFHWLALGEQILPVPWVEAVKASLVFFCPCCRFVPRHPCPTHTALHERPVPGVSASTGASCAPTIRILAQRCRHHSCRGLRQTSKHTAALRQSQAARCAVHVAGTADRGAMEVW